METVAHEERQPPASGAERLVAWVTAAESLIVTAVFLDLVTGRHVSRTLARAWHRRQRQLARERDIRSEVNRVLFEATMVVDDAKNAA